MRILIMAVLLLSSPLGSAGEIAGLGIQSCGAYLEDIARGGNAGDNYIFGYTSYVQGFLAGGNVTRRWNSMPTFEIPDHAAIRGYIKNYCEENPLDQIYLASATLLSKLIKDADAAEAGKE